LAVGKVIIMSLFGGEGMKATVAYVGFTIMIGSVGYEARHVSDPCVMTFSRFWFFEKEEVYSLICGTIQYVVLAFFVGGEVFDGKGEFRVSRIDGVQIYCNFWILFFEKGNLFWGHWKVDAADFQ